MLTQVQLVAEIQKRIPAYEELPEGFRTAVWNMFDVLQHGVAAEAQLRSLEEDMEREIQHRLGVPDTGIGKLKANEVKDAAEILRSRSEVGKPKNAIEFQHLLSDALTRNEKHFGFTPNLTEQRPGGQALTYLGFIQSEAFRTQVSNGLTWKDPLVPGAHGEFSHRIQWYIAMKACQVPGVERGWVGFYQGVGAVKHTTRVVRDLTEWSGQGLWDVLVDRNASTGRNLNGPYNTTEATEFTSPENLDPYLRTGLQSCPLLTSFLQARFAKRQQIRQNKDLLNAYICKKLFGSRVSYEHLSQADKEIIRGIAEGKAQSADTGIVKPGQYRATTQ